MRFSSVGGGQYALLEMHARVLLWCSVARATKRRAPAHAKQSAAPPTRKGVTASRLRFVLHASRRHADVAVLQETESRRRL